MYNNKNISESIWYLFLICFVASLGGLLFGFDTAVISGTVGKVEIQFSLSKLEVGWFTSSALIGCILGAIVPGFNNFLFSHIIFKFILFIF